MSEAQEIRELINYLERRTASAEEVQAAVLIEKLQAENAALRQRVAELENALSEIFSMVNGEASHLLDEDSGGNARLYLEIDALLAAAEQGVKNGN